jgi:hypothetical protein
MWPTDIMSVDEVNDEGVPLDMTVNMRLSKVYGLAAQQRVSVILQGFNDLTKNKKGQTFQKLYSSICSISERAEAEGEEGSYENHLSCLEEQQE